MKYLGFIVLILCGSISAQMFFDDFEDDYIGDWTERCNPANWYGSDGKAHCVGPPPSSPNALVPPGDIYATDCVLQASGSAVHVLGLVARLNEYDSGIMGYVSPDHDVARIRLISNGSSGTILTSINYDFPSGVDYTITFTCDGDSVLFHIEAPALDMEWELSAIDPNPVAGQFGLLTGSEPHAYWDWFSASGSTASYDTGLWACTVDDDLQGASYGDGDMAFEAGETIEMGLALSNGGPDDLENAFAILQSLSSDITVQVSSVEFGTIPAGSFAWSGSDYVLSAAPYAEEGVTYPMRLSLFADGGYFSQHDFDLPLGSGCVSDAETGAGEWSWGSLGTGWGNQWHVSGQRNHTPGGSSSFKCGDAGSGDYADHLYCGLDTPFFNMALNSSVSFWMWIDAQCARSAEDAMDGGRLQIGQFGHWQDLFPDEDYPYQIMSPTTGPFEPGTGVYSGYHGWQLVTVDIPDSLCGPRQLRWVFGSDDSGNREGWYIDDIVVDSDQVPVEGSETPIAPAGISVYPNPSGGLVRFSMTGTASRDILVEVYDMSGRVVWTHLGQLGSDGGLELYWDLEGSSGIRIPAGIYTAVMRTGGQRLSTRMVVTDPH